jgi:phosphate/sulfate permease
MFGLSTGIFLLLVFCLLLACLFEFINGFHDTANAVATVIYTNTLKPTAAVVWSGIWNFIGVNIGGIAVAMGIVNLLPVELLIDQSLAHGLAMVFALLISAIVWNFGTWFVGLPASSSHALIGSIIGIGIACNFIPNSQGAAVNWSKAQEIGLSLLISPFFGFAFAIGVMYLFKRLVKNEEIYKEPIPGKTPPLWIRTILVTTCSLVSLGHGSNDGQKGVGLVMLILIGILPAQFSLDSSYEIENSYKHIVSVNQLVLKTDTTKLSLTEKKLLNDISTNSEQAASLLNSKTKVDEVALENRFIIRKNILIISKNTKALIDKGNLSISKNDMNSLNTSLKEIKNVTDYAPKWVIIMIAISLALGTMIGWKRIVKTVGEKIGKQHMSYAQGASAEIVAAVTVGLSSFKGLPVSTTHVLSSGIAGTMVAKKGLKNLQKKTIRNILLAWVLTLPVTMLMSGGLFLLFRALF